MVNNVMTSRHSSQGGIGAPVRRHEDARLLRGLGRFTDDLAPARAAHAVIVRSPHASAVITAIEAAAARAMPGVLAVLTGEDAVADGLGSIETPFERQRRGGRMPRPPYPVLARERVHFAGDAVAMVVAATMAQAQDAAERIDVAYDPLPAVTDVAAAVAPGAVAVWPDAAPDNVCFTFAAGDAAAVATAFAAAHHVARLAFRISRVAANPLEPRAAIGMFDAGEERYTLITGAQAPVSLRNDLARTILRVPASRLRVISPDVGGAFGMKGGPYPEHALVLWAARRVGCPVRWAATRGESFISDLHARDNVSEVELALDGDGTFLAMRVRTLANLGGYLAPATLLPPVSNLGGLAGTYRTPAIHVAVTGVFTHTQPTGPYRGAGRPEATYAIERVIDQAARDMGIDRAELRRRNLIPANAMPFRTGLNYTYDSGNFAENMRLALQQSDWAGFPARREQAAARGRLRGIAVINAIEIAGGPHRAPLEEAADIRFDAAGDATIVLGTHSHGQGHETAFRQIAASMLGLDPARLRIAFGDTDLVAHGRGTFGSRSIVAAGTALHAAAIKLIARGRGLAARMLEAAEADIEFEAGAFRVAGTDRVLRIEEVAARSYNASAMPHGQELGFAERSVISASDASFPNGCHVCEIEIDPETGAVAIVAYTVVDDVGTVINPLLLEGQIHGGVAQGIGQALGEAIVYDPDSGQILSGSFADYIMPRADDLPFVAVTSNPSPTPSNPIGAKGAGEAGTVGAIPAVMNAVLDALHPLGVTDLEMPATAARVWYAIQAARRGATL